MMMDTKDLYKLFAVLDDLATLRRGLDDLVDDLPDGSARNARELLEVAQQTWSNVADIVDNLQIAGVLHFDPANRARAVAAATGDEAQAEDDFPRELFEKLLLRFVEENFTPEEIRKYQNGIDIGLADDDNGGAVRTVLRFDTATATGLRERGV